MFWSVDKGICCDIIIIGKMVEPVTMILAIFKFFLLFFIILK